MQRFVVNSTAEERGLRSGQKRLGLLSHEADVGQTFGVWEVGPAPTVQLPLLGALNVSGTEGAVFGFVAICSRETREARSPRS